MTTTLTSNSYGINNNPFNYHKFEQIERNIGAQWLSLEQITNQLNLFQDESQDEYLLSLELAVRMHIEDYLGMPIFDVSYRVYYGSEMYGSPVSFDLPQTSLNGITINSVKYYNLSNVLTTIASSNYYYDASGDKIVLNSMPTDINTNRTSPIVIEYTLAESDLAQYPVIKQAGLLLFTHLYNNRSETTNGGLQTIPYGVDALLRPYKPLVM